jgi:deoxycytidylate deaminase
MNGNKHIESNLLTDNVGCTHSDRSSMLVFSICGQVGSGLTLVRRKIAQTLSSFGYQCIAVDISQVVLEKFYSKLMGEEKISDHPDLKSNSARRIYMLQRRGNQLRARFGNDIITRVSISHVIWPEFKQTRNHRIAWLIDSVKHHEEVAYLRELFGESYFAIGVISTDSVRKRRLMEKKGFSGDEFNVLSDIDAKEKGLEYGQSTIKAITQSDYFFANDYATADNLEIEAQRLLRLIFSVGVDTPRLDEYAMSIAANAANQSGCLARQVGACIVNASGQLIATGRNDVPQYGGGLYTVESKKDHRCWAQAGQCYNDFHKMKIIQGLTREISESLDLPREKRDSVEEILKHSPIDSLIEFSRAVHAEMDALTSIAREEIPGVKGASLYCTTFPCHNCAKHIISAGIRRVVYLEPYEKSLARELHSDAIMNPLQDCEGGKIPFDSFGGVAPRRYSQLFGINRRRKDRENGKYIDLDSKRDNLHPIGTQDEKSLYQKVEKAAMMLVENAPEIESKP